MRGVDHGFGVVHCPERMRVPMVDPEWFSLFVEGAHLFGELADVEFVGVHVDVSRG